MVTADRHAERAELLAYLDRLADNGGRVPCRSFAADVAGLWTSDDAAEQGYAARLCVGCAALTACDTYGLTWPKETGVYGGRTEWERRSASQVEGVSAYV